MNEERSVIKRIREISDDELGVISAHLQKEKLKAVTVNPVRWNMLYNIGDAISEESRRRAQGGHRILALKEYDLALHCPECKGYGVVQTSVDDFEACSLGCPQTI